MTSDALVISEEQVVENLSFVEQALKKRKVMVSESVYTDTRYIFPTTNLVERFFSKAGHTLDQRRHQITPANLEMQLFLHLNRSLWDITDVKQILQ